jgi:hypothetical protein
MVTAVRIYYRDSDVCITSSAFWVRGQGYRLRDIERAWRVRRRMVGRRAVVAGLMLALMVVSQVALLMIGGLVWAGSGIALGAVTVLVLRAVARMIAGATALNAVENIRRYRRRLELWAVVSGAQTLLLDTDDAIVHGQVCRALGRALEDRDQRRRHLDRQTFGRRTVSEPRSHVP